jgi:hypothetical protein
MTEEQFLTLDAIVFQNSLYNKITLNDECPVFGFILIPPLLT